MKWRISPRTLLGYILVVGCALGASAYWSDPVVQYRWRRDQISLCRVLGRRIAAGDTLARVETLVGSTERFDAQTEKSLLTIRKRVAAGMPGEFLDGVRDDDQIRSIDRKGVGMMIQVRGGRLVNHNPAYFNHIVEGWEARNQSFGPFGWFR